MVQQIEQMYLTLGRLAMEGEAGRTSVGRDRNQIKLIEVRMALKNNIRYDWTIGEMAERLLCGTSSSIKEIAYLCGFSSLSYFSKLFKKRTGFSPREYRFGRGREDTKE